MNASHDRHLSTSVSSRRAPRACASFSSRTRSVLSDDWSISSSTRDCPPTRLFPFARRRRARRWSGRRTTPPSPPSPPSRASRSRPFERTSRGERKTIRPARFRTSGAAHDDTGHTSFVSVHPASIFSAIRPETSTTPSRRTRLSIPPSTRVASARAVGDLARPRRRLLLRRPRLARARAVAIVVVVVVVARRSSPPARRPRRAARRARGRRVAPTRRHRRSKTSRPSRARASAASRTGPPGSAPP